MTKRFRGEERRRAKRKPGLLSGIGRREFMAAGAGATAGAVGLGLHPEAASSQEAPLARAGASGFQSIEIDSPMARCKEPQHLAFIQGATERFSFPNWQSGNDDSVFYNLNIPSFFKSRVVAEPDAFSLLERNIQPDLLDLTFTTHDGTKTPPLRATSSGLVRRHRSFTGLPPGRCADAGWGMTGSSSGRRPQHPHYPRCLIGVRLLILTIWPAFAF